MMKAFTPTAVVPTFLLFSNPICPFAHRTILTRLEYGCPLAHIVEVSYVGISEPASSREGEKEKQEQQTSSQEGEKEKQEQQTSSSSSTSTSENKKGTKKEGVMQDWYWNIWPKEKKGEHPQVPLLFRLKDAASKAKLHEELESGRDGDAMVESCDIMKHFARMVEDGEEGPEEGCKFLFSSSSSSLSSEPTSVSGGGVRRDRNQQQQQQQQHQSSSNSISLYPKKHRKQIDEFLSWLDVGPVYDLIMCSKADMKQQFENARAWTSSLEERYAESPLNAEDAPYFLGDQYSLIDISIVPFFERVVPISKMFLDFDLLTEKDTPRLLRMFNAARQRPSMLLSSVPPATFAKFYVQEEYIQKEITEGVKF